MPRKLDRIDLKMLRLLQANGRLTNAELAQRSTVSPATCHRRTQRLFDEGYISRRAVVDAAEGRPRRAGDGRRRARPLDAGEFRAISRRPSRS